MTALTYAGEMPTPGADEDTWGTELVVIGGKLYVDLSMMNTAPTATFLGRITAGTGEVERLTVAQATSMFNVFGGDSGSGGLKGLVPATVAGDKNKVLTGAGTFQHGYGRAFGCVITTTNVNGSQPTFTNGLNVASLSTLTVVGAQSSCVITFTDALPDATYSAHVTPYNLLVPGAYGAKTTTSVVVFWENAAGNPTEISVSGFA